MSEINIKNRLGWKRQLKDSRDYKFTALHAAPNTLPPRVDLRSLCPPVVDQGNLGSCTANGIAAAHEFAQMKQLESAFAPSRLFIYYNERAIEGTIKEDSGANIRDGFKSIGANGVCPETLWTYDIAKFARKPPKKAFTESIKHKALNYSAVGQTATELMGCLADGFPIVFGFEVFASFESDAVAKTGIVPMPKRGEENLGGHCVVLTSYDAQSRLFGFRNSWGIEFGDKGYGYLPFEYVLNPDLASDFWTIKLIA